MTDASENSREALGLLSFLKTETSKEDLATTLRVLREFKECESQKEWVNISFVAWAKLEQMEEFLAHLVEGKPLEDDTKAAIARRTR